MILTLPPGHGIPGVNTLLPAILSGVVRVVGAGLICVIGIWLSGKSEYFASRLLSHLRHFDEMLRDFFANLVRYFVLTLTGLTVLSQFGVQTTSLVAVIGAASLAIGLALQGTLSNLAAGVMLLIFRPFRLGHHVQIGGNDGVVKELTLFWTEVVSADNVQIIVPNSQVWGQPLKNLSVYAAPPATVLVRFSVTEASLPSVRQCIEDVIAAMPDIAAAPPPVVLADHAAADNALQLVVKVSPANGADGDVLKSEIIERVVASLAELAPAR